MVSARSGRAFRWTTIVLLTIGVLVVEQRTFGDGPPTNETRRGQNRLPPHYGGVVDQRQREEIYKLQDEYKPKIQAMQAQLNALKKELNGKIVAVLTPDQKKKVKEAAGKAKAKKAKPVEAVPDTFAPEPEKKAE